MIDITDKLDDQVPEGFDGIMLVYVPHTSAAVCVNEGADPDVQRDVIGFLDRMVPWDQKEFRHAEGNSAAHIKSILVGNSQQLIIADGRLQLGTWEKVFFCEFDGPRQRKVYIKLS